MVVILSIAAMLLGSEVLRLGRQVEEVRFAAEWAKAEAQYLHDRVGALESEVAQLKKESGLHDSILEGMLKGR